ncbi:substrate-binding domain-containing protein [Cellulomonas hominis]|uniref:substrate-binding domain-containing protein n=1 Tax=Cellulomonas hominis TaxID=156981 RepID=UPI001C10A0AB|nr:substrate-binding domain-containing protein [Cellulomonas hominis]MBU5423436.1 substrate-binding domain-containing protein [Cellulomonas hominis]
MSDGTSRHLAVSRRAQVLEALHAHGTVRVSDLAAELGVTTVTVRRDITQLVDEGLALRVHGGATLNPAADPAPGAPVPPAAPAGPAPGSTGTIGMLVPSLDYYWPGVARGAEERAAAGGLRLRLRGSSYEIEDERPQLERLMRGGADALLVAPSLDSPHTEDVLAWLGDVDVPVVLVERTARTGSTHAAMESVVTDHALGAETAVRHLTALGHRRIGIALSAQSPHTPELRAGWSRALAACGLDPDGAVDLDIPDRRAADWQQHVEAVVEAALRTGTTALLVHSDPEAMGVVQHCEERGVPVPDALSVVAYDDEVAGLFSPALTAVRPPRAWVGRAAVDLAVARLADPARPVHRVVVSPSLVLRDSTAAPTG